VKELQTYVGRLYRRDPNSLAGLVEDVRASRTARFRSFVELRDALLSGRLPFARRPTRGLGVSRLRTALPRD
jgi:hypothetical protein